MCRPYVRGYSIVEAMAVVVVLVSIVTMAFPSFADLIERNRTRALADRLQSQLAHARIASVTGRHDVTLCGSSDGEHCDGDWGRGWLLRVPGSEAPPLGSYRLQARESLRWSGFSRVIRFRSNGTSPVGNGRFYICDRRRNEVAWQLVINRQGRVQRIRGAAEGVACG